MGNGYVEVEEFVTPGRVEWAYRRAMEAQHFRKQRFADVGWRAANDRDSRLLKVLEKSASILAQMDENQRGQTRRSADAAYAEQRETTVVQLWKAAYETVDKGTPSRPLEWIYGAAAYMCGYLA
jgi:hypothetical protein